MAVVPTNQKTRPLIRDYWPRYKKLALFVTIGMQLAIILVIALSLLVGGVSAASMGFWITIMATMLVIVPLNSILVLQLLVPLRDLTNTITSVAGEKPRYALANPNAPRYAKDGFREVLQFVYEKAASQDRTQPTQADTSEGAAVVDALSHSKAGVVVLGSDGAIRYANRAAPLRQLEDGKRELTLLFDPAAAFDDWLAQCRNSAVHAEKTWYRVADRIVGDEDRRVFNISANYEKGSDAEVILVLFDATDTYKPEDEDLDFISFAAHELRGPITVIRGYLDVLDIELGEQLAPDQKELMSRLIVSANRLTGYINNILNASKYDRRHLKVHLAEDTIAAVYDTVKDDLALRASSQRRMLAVAIPPDLPTVAIDRSSIGEVIANLVDNAIKYTNEGGAVSVSAAVDGQFVKVSVTDNGIGIPANVVGNLFHKFYRSHRSRETVAGTGIGLYICKAIVESHRGSIEVTSVEGQGSTFSFSVPIYASVADKLQANDFTNAGLISSNQGWIKNHAKFKG